MRKIGPALAGLLTLCGCATVGEQTLPAGLGAGPQPGQTLAYSGSASDTMIAGQAAKAAFGAIGALLMVQDGKNIVRENHIQDPAGPMAHNLAAEFATARGAHLASVPLASGDKAAASQTSAPYVLVVETMGWGFMYYPTGWAHYKVSYTGRLRLWSTATNANVAVKVCKWDSDMDGGAKPTRADLLDNGAAGLKADFAKAAAVCTDQFRSVLDLAPAGSRQAQR